MVISQGTIQIQAATVMPGDVLLDGGVVSKVRVIGPFVKIETDADRLIYPGRTELVALRSLRMDD